MSKRSYGGAFNPIVIGGKRAMGVVRRKLRARRTRAFRRGYDRTGGFYGRFSGRNAEYKFFDTVLAFNFDATAEVPATGQLNLIPQGITESTRVGRKCTIRSIQIRGMYAYAPGASASSAAMSYLYLVLDKQANGAAAAASGDGGVFTGTTLSEAMLNLSESHRFVVLKKWIQPHVPTAGATTAYNVVTHKLEYHKRCMIPIEFSNTTGAIAEIRSMNLFLIAGADGVGAAFDDLTSFQGKCRVRFSDL